MGPQGPIGPAGQQGPRGPRGPEPRKENIMRMLAELGFEFRGGKVVGFNGTYD